MADSHKSSGREARRARVFVVAPDGEPLNFFGTAKIDGPWLTVWPDDPEWPVSTYPAEHISVIEWEGERDW